MTYGVIRVGLSSWSGNIGALAATAAAGAAEPAHHTRSRRGSPKPFVFRHCKHLGDVIEAACKASPEFDGGGPVVHPRMGECGHLSQTLPQGTVHVCLEAASVGFLYPSERGGYVRIRCRRRSHTPNHRLRDVLMSKPRTILGVSTACGRGVMGPGSGISYADQPRSEDSMRVRIEYCGA